MTAYTQSNGKAAPQDFIIVRWGKISPGDEPAYLVHGLIPREGLVVVWGPPKCGKTFWTFDLVAHVALNWSYRGRRVEPGTVVYIACEGERGLAARKEAFQQSRLSEDADPPFYLLTTRLNLPAEVDKLSLDIAAQIPPGELCAAIVLDTLNRSIRGSESKDEDMSAYIVAADALRERFKCAVIIIHHSGIDASRPRGHTSLTGAVDAQLAVKRDANGLVIVTLEWMKDGPEGEVIASELKVIEIGSDRNGEAMASCVVEPAEYTAKSAKAERTLAPSVQIARNQLVEAINRAGAVPPACDHIPSNTKAVNYDVWRGYCYKAGISSTDTPDAKKKAFSRSAEKLIATGVAGKWEPWVWLAR